MRTRRWVWLSVVLLGAGALYVHAVRAGGEAKKPHLEYRTTYAEALLEGRLRNLPVFVSRQKDE